MISFDGHGDDDRLFQVDFSFPDRSISGRSNLTISYKIMGVRYAKLHDDWIGNFELALPTSSFKPTETNAKNLYKTHVSVFRETFENLNLAEDLSIDRFIETAMPSKTKMCELQR
ncbi:hypothetical protein [Chamaesiphon sp. VAR_69_metabat_338]|uniref:hypothetical protein n=1 Tax=Chamaesiphon sp. VAR_69_metabat_338 TaxID=2964704 RepID=UPI00286DEB53|nr:hypothetical protein [Chamaesiphon sp. VAR_69_metabat_338]